MANVTTNYVPQLDYTSRDYAAIKADLVALASQYNPGWTATNEADLGVTLLELFAYLGDNLNFYIDRMANEGFLATASQDQSVLQLAAMLGYTPSTNTPATVTLTFSNTSASSQTIPAKTQIASSAVVNGLSTQIIFETDAAVTVPVGTNTATQTATQGVTTGLTEGTRETLGNSNGTPNQLFKISQTNVIISSISVYVAGISYSYGQNLIDYTPYDSVFTTITNADNFTYVVFGDGVGGRIPPSSQEIKVSYRVGNGADGNVGANTINSFLTNITSGITVFNQSAASGGSNDESVDSIRYNAPRALKTLRRAVSLKDYGYLALQVNGVSKAIADSASFTNVTLYATPFGDTGSSTASVGPITGVAITATGGGAGTGGITYSVASTTGLAVGQTVTITGIAPNSYNVNSATITALTTNISFTIASVATGTFNSGSSTSSLATVRTGNSSAFTAISTALTSYFTDKVAPNVSLTVSPATYVPIDLEMTVRVLPQYQSSSVLSQVNTAVANLVSLDNSFFADRLPVQYILNAASTVAGVDYSTVELLRFTSNQQIFAVSGWYRTSGVVTLNTLAVAGGTAHNITVGQQVRVNGVDTSVDGTYTVTAVTSTSLSFSNGAGTSGSSGTPNAVSSITNYVKVVQVDSITCGTNQIPAKGTFTITATGGTA